MESRAVVRAIGVAGLWLMMAASAVAGASGASPGRVDPEAVAREVFAGEDFWWKRIQPAEKAPTTSTSWFGSIRRAIVDFFGWLLDTVGKWLADLMRWLFGSIPTGSSGGTLWVWVIVVLFVGWLLWKLFPVLMRWVRAEKAAVVALGQTTWQTLPEAMDLFEQAGQALRAGMNAEAIRLALLALIARLETQGLLRYDHTRTNREYQTELRVKPQLAGPFGEVARIYDRVWYGRGPAGREEAELAIKVSGEVIQAGGPRL